MKKCKLHEVASLIAGYPFDGHKYSSDGIRVVRGDNVTIGNLRWDIDKRWNSPFKEAQIYSLKNEDIVIGMDGSRVGRNRAMVLESDLPLYLAQRVACVRHNDKSSQKYLYYVIFSNRFEQYIKTIHTGTSIPHISLDQLGDYEFLIPDITEQEKIGNLLFLLDKKISLNSRMNAELEAMAKQLYDYWFVQFDFPDENGKPYKSSGGKMVYNSTLKREIPEGWKVSTYGKEFDVKLGGTPSTSEELYWENGTINWLNSGEVQNFPVNETEKKITNLAVKSSSTEFLPKGSVLISITRYLRVTVLNIDACINQSVAGFAETDLYKYPYTYYALSAEVPRLMALRSGAQQPHINKETVEESPFILPPNDVLAKYYAKSTPIFELLFRQSEETKELTHLRDSLLPMLMNGQVTVE